MIKYIYNNNKINLKERLHLQSPYYLKNESKHTKLGYNNKKLLI